MSQATSPSPSSAEPRDDSQIRKLYKETTLFIRDTYSPFFNLYQKAMLGEKMKCYEDNKEKPETYFACIEKIDAKMSQNSTFLQQKFAQLDHVEIECQDSCKKEFPHFEEKYVQCRLKCINNLKDSCMGVYDKFYEANIGKHADFKKLPSTKK